MPEADQPHSTTPNGRRKLIRGAFAAPALMTVCSGSAFAAASHLRCLANAQTAPNPANAPWGTTATDSYVRVRLVSAQVPTSPQDPTLIERFFVRGQDLSYKTASGVPSSSQWQQIDIGTYAPIGGPVAPPANTSTAVNHYVIVRFDAEGFVVGLGQGDPGAIIGGSCLISAGPFIQP